MSSSKDALPNGNPAQASLRARRCEMRAVRVMLRIAFSFVSRICEVSEVKYEGWLDSPETWKPVNEIARTWASSWICLQVCRTWR